MILDHSKVFFHKNFRNNTLYVNKSVKSVFLIREPQIPKLRQKVTSKHQNNVILVKTSLRSEICEISI